LSNFQKKHDFKNKFLKEFDEFLNNLKNISKIQNKKLAEFHNKTEEFFNIKIEKYKRKLFKINDEFKKEFHLREFERFRKELFNKILRLKYSSKEKYQKKVKEIEDWFNQHYSKMISLVDRKVYMNEYPIYIYIICAFICMTFSFIFHTFYPISKTVNDVL
jgi:hypothetical protein